MCWRERGGGPSCPLHRRARRAAADAPPPFLHSPSECAASSPPDRSMPVMQGKKKGANPARGEGEQLHHGCRVRGKRREALSERGRGWSHPTPQQTLPPSFLPPFPPPLPPPPQASNCAVVVQVPNNKRVDLCQLHADVNLWAWHDGVRRPAVGAAPFARGWYECRFCQQGGHVSPVDYFDEKADGGIKRCKREGRKQGG